MVLRLPVIFLVSCSGFCAASTPKVERCSVSELSSSYVVHPSFVCDYSPLDFKRRLLSLLTIRGKPPTIENVEAAFGLPRLRASISEPRLSMMRSWALAKMASGGRYRLASTRPFTLTSRRGHPVSGVLAGRLSSTRVAAVTFV